MSYCHNCGRKADDYEKFCSDCGTELEIEATTSVKSGLHGANKSGYIFTNIRALAQKLNASQDEIKDILRSFISEKASFGISYNLIDASDYEPQLSENKGREKVIRLTPVESWQTHQRLLTDRYVYDTEYRKIEVDYLFIVGGDDIIPMPKLDNPRPDYDLDLDSDLPYTYLYGSETEGRLEDGSIFFLNPMMLCGRLPMAADASVEYLISYLKRATAITGKGFQNGSIYGQSDPNWQRISSIVTGELYENGWMVPYKELDGYLYKSLVLSPLVDSDAISRIFSPDAIIYYFNMHGSSALQSPGYTGKSLKDERGEQYSVQGISPEEWNDTQYNNIVVSEACYGARFIGKPYKYSMLLSALNNKTALFVGSSRISEGAIDAAGGHSSTHLHNADIIARTFILAFLSGYDAGQSMFIAKSEVFSSGSVEDPSDRLTVLEFNLYGDPTLTFAPAVEVTKSTSKKSFISDKKYSGPLAEGDKNTTFYSKEIYSDKPSSLLGMVRHAVNKNIEDINGKINEHLYSQYNITPRRLEKVLECGSSGSSDKTYLYTYSVGEEDHVCVKLDANNKITKVVTTK